MNISVSPEARDKLGNNPSKAVEELAVNKFETVEDMKQAFVYLREQLKVLDDIDSRMTNIENIVKDTTGGAD